MTLTTRHSDAMYRWLLATIGWNEVSEGMEREEAKWAALREAAARWPRQMAYFAKGEE